MNTAIINVKTEPETKKRAQELADQFGMSLSTLVNVCLKQVIRTGTIEASVVQEIPNEETIQAFKEAEEYINSPEFGKEAMTPQQALDYVASIIREKSKEES